MTMKPKSRKFRIRRHTEKPASGAQDMPFDTGEDGFGDAPFPGSARAEADKANDKTIAEIRQEGLTGRQLRMARRVAQKFGLSPKSDFDAVRLLRAKGIDPFDRGNMLEVVSAKRTSQLQKPDPNGAGVTSTATERKRPQPVPNLPQTVAPPADAGLPGEPTRDDALRLHEVERIQRDIVRRRRRNLVLLAARLGAFVFLPTLLAWIYFAFVATPGYATKSEFVVQQAESASTSPGLLGNTALATSQDSIMVQDFLTSREALALLDADQLRDIGVTREEADAEASRPIWDTPTTWR